MNFLPDFIITFGKKVNMNISFWANNNECVVVGMKVLEMRMSATRHFHKCDDIQGCKELIIKLFVQILGTWQFNNAYFKCVFYFLKYLLKI